MERAQNHRMRFAMDVKLFVRHRGSRQVTVLHSHEELARVGTEGATALALAYASFITGPTCTQLSVAIKSKPSIRSWTTESTLATLPLVKDLVWRRLLDGPPKCSTWRIQ